MRTIEYRSINKSTWGDGPWLTEPDKKQWLDEATSLPCLAVRHPESGHWCGYVGVAKPHPLFGKGYDDPDADVHGGLTFADACDHRPEDVAICHVPSSGEPDNVWWFGFDCAHYRDMSPGDFVEHRS